MSGPDTHGLDEYLGYARAHGALSDTKGWVSDLEDMLRIAWDLLTPEAQDAFRQHPDLLAMVESAGGTT